MNEFENWFKNCQQYELMDGYDFEMEAAFNAGRTVERERILADEIKARFWLGDEK